MFSTSSTDLVSWLFVMMRYRVRSRNPKPRNICLVYQSFSVHQLTTRHNSWFMALKAIKFNYLRAIWRLCENTGPSWHIAVEFNKSFICMLGLHPSTVNKSLWKRPAFFKNLHQFKRTNIFLVTAISENFQITKKKPKKKHQQWQQKRKAIMK